MELKQFCIENIIVLTVESRVKWKSRTASLSADSQWSKQSVYFARATQVWLPVNHNASIISAKKFDVSKRIARASELGSCQSICVI